MAELTTTSPKPKVVSIASYKADAAPLFVALLVMSPQGILIVTSIELNGINLDKIEFSLISLAVLILY